MKITTTFCLTVSLLLSNTVQSASVAIDEFLIDSILVSITDYSTESGERATEGYRVNKFNDGILPEFTMGSFENPVFDLTGGDESSYAIIYPAFDPDDYSPAPSGWVDGSTMDVDFGNMRLDFDGYEDAFKPLNSTLNYGSFNVDTYAFDMSWTSYLYGDSNLELTVNLNGFLTMAPVPVPAAVWLFGSGLIGLVGFAKRKKA